MNILAQCKCPNITQLFGSYIQGRRLWIVMELMSVGSVSEVVKAQGAFHEEAIAAVLHGSTEGLVYLHAHGHTHCDVKTANILLSPSGAVKLCDLGVALSVSKKAASQFLEDQKAQEEGKTEAERRPSYHDWFPKPESKSERKKAEKKDPDFAGTPFYMAPEVISLAGMTPKSDIWSLGIVAMELALGKCPRSDLHPLKVRRSRKVEVREAAPEGRGGREGAAIHFVSLLSFFLSLISFFCHSKQVMQLVVREPAPRLQGKFNSKLIEFCDMCLQKDPASVRPWKSISKRGP